MVSSPVDNEFNEVYLWNYMGQFDEPSGTWDDINLPLTIPLLAGTGYFAYNYTVDPNGLWPPSPDSAVFDGTLNSLDIDVTLSNTDASPYSGWNLLGNPYPVSLEWNGHTDWALNNVQATMYVYNSASGNYETWNYLSGGTNANGGMIAATQAFWVRTGDTLGNPASLTIPASQRLHSDASFLKSSGAFLPDQVLLTVEDDFNADKTIVGFMKPSTGKYDVNYDGIYRKANQDVISLYSVVSGVNYALNQLPAIDEYQSVQINFKPAFTGFCMMSASWLESFDITQPIYLEDKKTNIFYNLRENHVNQFYAEKSDAAERFVLHFKEPEFNGNLSDLINIYSHGKNVYVMIPPSTTGEVQIYDMTGRLVYQAHTNSEYNKILLNAKTGNYIVRFVTSENFVVQKVQIK